MFTIWHEMATGPAVEIFRSLSEPNYTYIYQSSDFDCSGEQWWSWVAGEGIVMDGRQVRRGGSAAVAETTEPHSWATVSGAAVSHPTAAVSTFTTTAVLITAGVFYPAAAVLPPTAAQGNCRDVPRQAAWPAQQVVTNHWPNGKAYWWKKLLRHWQQEEVNS